MELKNINEYNPEYRKNGIIWKKIGEPVGKKGKHLRSKKKYPLIDINKINLTTSYTIDRETLEKSRNLYEITKKMIPVYLSYDFKLIGGYEQYELAKELKLKRIPFQRINKLNNRQKKKFRDEIHTQKIGNKKYKIKAENGTNFYVSLNRFKKFKSIKKAVNAKGHHLVVFPNFTFSVKDKENNYIKGSQNKGVALNAIQNKYYKKQGR